MAGNLIPESFLDDFDVQLQDFFHRVICKVAKLNVRWKAIAVKKAMVEVMSGFNKKTVTKGESAIRFDSDARRYAYVLRHGTCFNSAVASYLMKFIDQETNKNIVLKILETGRLNICCLGGGPALVAVAVIKVARALYHPLWLQSKRKLSVQVTVVDMHEGWSETLKNVFDYLKETPEFFGVDELALDYRFVTADPTEPMNEKVVGAVQSADIITLVYFLSAINGSKNRDKSLPMLQKIMQNMKEEAFLFFLDSAADKHYKMLHEAADNEGNLQEIYGPLLEEFHTISLESVSRYLDLYAESFDTFFCMTNIFLCVSSWRKMKTTQSPTKDERFDSSMKPSQAESDELTKKMRQYRASVETLIDEKKSRIKKQLYENMIF